MQGNGKDQGGLSFVLECACVRPDGVPSVRGCLVLPEGFLRKEWGSQPEKPSKSVLSSLFTGLVGFACHAV